MRSERINSLKLQNEFSINGVKCQHFGEFIRIKDDNILYRSYKDEDTVSVLGEIIDLYRSGEKISKIAKKTRRSTVVIHRLMKDVGEPMRKQGGQQSSHDRLYMARGVGRFRVDFSDSSMT